MADLVGGQPSVEWGPLPPTISYAAVLKQPKQPAKSVSFKPVTYLHGELQVIWEQAEVDQMIINENLEYAIIDKFSYGWPEIQELRRLISKQCELKGE